MQNILIWASFVAELANTIAQDPNSPINDRAKGVLSLLVLGLRAGTLTDSDLAALKAQYTADVAANRPVTRQELVDLDAKLALVSAQIQAG